MDQEDHYGNWPTSTLGSSYHATKKVRVLCEECSAKFSYVHDKTHHLRTEHGEHPCHECRGVFESRAALDAHKLIVHPPEMFLCSNCMTVYRTLKEYDAHKRQFHPRLRRNVKTNLDDGIAHIDYGIRRHPVAGRQSHQHERNACRGRVPL